MAGTGEAKKEEADYKRLHSFPLIRHTDMPEEMRVETMELCVTACEKFATNNEVSVSSVTSFNHTLRLWAPRAVLDLLSVHAPSHIETMGPKSCTGPPICSRSVTH
ncbi:dynein light chain 4, axonemal isoform X2 [Gymnodraco acuticeps]|uniref:Dynein light chain 4, axonemal isoform X2 n=1 Tax=Gymnodraco acuticeps TaxID=8218 RepID=A0A6P8U8I5_GYMAC|nr:dynein light chain 4, axonemal isoform X2 [Gymnodraco acuticeps]